MYEYMCMIIFVFHHTYIDIHLYDTQFNPELGQIAPSIATGGLAVRSSDGPLLATSKTQPKEPAPRCCPTCAQFLGAGRFWAPSQRFVHEFLVGLFLKKKFINGLYHRKLLNTPILTQYNWTNYQIGLSKKGSSIGLSIPNI